MIDQVRSSTTEEATARILERCEVLAQITDEPGCITRGFLSPAMAEVTTLVARWMEEAGLTTELDVVGNLIGTYPCSDDDAPVLVLGSHLDTVSDAGRYDGVLGVLLALATVEALGGAPLPFALEVVAFADEEGLRYGVPFLGSRALVGDLEPAWLPRRDCDGVTMADAIKAWGGDPTEAPSRYAGRRMIGYVEAHIEQGPALEQRGLSLGVLDALSGACWMRLRLDGCAGHAGTTPMPLRCDPVPAAAEMVLAVEGLALREPDLVATVGKMKLSPGASNVIAGSVEMSLDLRHPDDGCLAKSIESLLGECRRISERRGLQLHHETLHSQSGVEADDRLSTLLRETAAASGVETGDLVVGAGHDSLIMARIMPMAMLLLRSPGGISHHPDESVLPGDVGDAFNVLHAFVLRIALDFVPGETDSDPVFIRVEDRTSSAGVDLDLEG